MNEIVNYSVEELINKISNSQITSVEICEAYIERVNKFEKDINAWAFFDKELLLEKAKESDAYKKSGKPTGQLHGIPVAVKDIVGTLDMPTECGTPIRKGKSYSQNAEIVDLLTSSGAIVMGKTVTTELAYLNLSILYKEKNQLSKSIKILKKGINVSPNFMPFYKNLATFYRNSGQLKLAIETNLFIISRNKFDFNSFYELSGIYDFKNHKNELNFLLNTKLENLNPNSKIYAAFAISNLLHKQGKFKESAKFLKIANDESAKYKKSDLSLKIKHTEFYRSLKIKNSKNKYLENSSNYIFIVGMPRSGSTLLENILSLNPEVTDMGEVNFLEESIKEAKDFEDVFDLYEKKVINQFPSSIIYTDKNLFNYMYCAVISNFFPKAKIINCIRNPLDNILSIYRANFLKQSFSFSLPDISSLYINYFETMEGYKTKYSENIYDYYYEDLIENPKDVITRIINWLDWDWNEKYLSPHQNKRNVYTASSAQIRKKFYSSSIGIWKEYKELLEPAIEIIKTNKILGEKISQ